MAAEFVRAVVVTVITVLVPAVTDGGANVAAAPVGSPVAEKFSVAAAPAPAGAVGIVKFADWPAGTVWEAGWFGSEKPTMASVTAPEVPPPGVGLNTVAEAVPDAEMAPAVTDAVNCVALPNVVARAVPLSFTTEVLIKLVPVTVSETAAPAETVEGCNPVSAGIGLPAALIVNVSAPDVPPPGVGLNTVTEAVPAVAMSLAGTAAVNCVAVPGVVTNAAPFHFTTEVLMKFVPVTVSVNAAPPAVAEDG